MFKSMPGVELLWLTGPSGDNAVLNSVAQPEYEGVFRIAPCVSSPQRGMTGTATYGEVR